MSTDYTSPDLQFKHTRITQCRCSLGDICTQGTLPMLDYVVVSHSQYPLDTYSNSRDTLLHNVASYH